jgi:two-component system, chemotaxis family, sensor kinase Cph1
MKKINNMNLYGRLKCLFWGLALSWTGVVAASMIWNYYDQNEKIFEIALNNAHLTFEKDVIYRKWVARHGGVYVPASRFTPPNPYLKVPERDIVTASGSLLTLINPAYMTRQVNEMATNVHSRSHITSLNPIQPQNTPDSWETSALGAFEKGNKEVRSVAQLNGQEHMRVMRPFITEKECLKCHAAQGYKEGDIRGGISVAIPLAPLWAIERPFIFKIALAHLFLWIVGISGILISRKMLTNQIFARQLAESEFNQSENKFQIVADFTFAMESWRDPDGRFVYLSPSCERVTGYTREEFIEDPDLYLRIIHPDDRQRMSDHFVEDLSYCQLSEMEFRIIHRDGRERWIGHVCQAVLGGQGQILGRRASDRDITERKRAIEALQKSRDELELRVQERTADLNMTIARLEQLNKDMEEFNYVASHDLQEPLRKIETFMDMIKERCSPHLDETGLDYLDRVHHSASRMRQLLRDLLQLSRVTTKTTPHIEIDLKKTIREAADVFETVIKETGGQIEVETMPVIEADESQMRQLFQNLIGNALKYHGSEVPYIKVYGYLVGRGECEIFVEDNGIGFDQQFAELIFKPFERLHGHKYEGTGVGLAICRKIVERHGGTIRAESEPGQGSTFIVRLPLKQLNSLRDGE